MHTCYDLSDYMYTKRLDDYIYTERPWIDIDYKGRTLIKANTHTHTQMN